MPDNCVAWSSVERQHVLVCPDDLCRNGSPLCGLEEGIDFYERQHFDDYEDDYEFQHEDEEECIGPEGDCGIKADGHLPPCPLASGSGPA